MKAHDQHVGNALAVVGFPECWVQLIIAEEVSSMELAIILVNLAVMS